MNDSKTILVFGATGGIGQTVTEMLAQKDCHLILIANDNELLETMKAENQNETSTIEVLSGDFGSESGYMNLCDNLSERLNTIDWILHCAGYISTEESLPAPQTNLIKKTFEINYFAPTYITEILSPKITKGVIFITSTAAINGNGYFPAYASAKGALTTFARSLSLHWKETEKRSIILCPGPTKTAMRERIAGDSNLKQSPEVIAGLINSMIEDAASYPNGCEFVVRDGNITAQ